MKSRDGASQGQFGPKFPQNYLISYVFWSLLMAVERQFDHHSQQFSKDSRKCSPYSWSCEIVNSFMRKVSNYNICWVIEIFLSRRPSRRRQPIHCRDSYFYEAAAKNTNCKAHKTFFWQAYVFWYLLFVYSLEYNKGNGNKRWLGISWHRNVWIHWR